MAVQEAGKIRGLRWAKLSPFERSLILFVIITAAQIIGRISAGGDADGQFVFEAMIRAAFVSVILWGVISAIRSHRSK